MVGPWPLAPHPDHLIYTSCTSNATGSKSGHYNVEDVDVDSESEHEDSNTSDI